MMRVLTKCMLVAAVASLAFAGSTTASFAAKKKAAKAKACTPWTYQQRGACFERCGLDGKWYRSIWSSMTKC
jgi:hypothetical protein